MMLCNGHSDLDILRKQTEILFTNTIDKIDHYTENYNKKFARTGPQIPQEVSMLPEIYGHYEITNKFMLEPSTGKLVATDQKMADSVVSITGDIFRGSISEAGREEFFWNAGAPTKVTGYYYCNNVISKLEYVIKKKEAYPPGIK